MYIKDIVIFGSIDWNTNWQTQHRLVNSYLNEGHRVLFIENTGVRAPRISDFSRLIDRIRFRKNSVRGFSEYKKGLTILSPILFPLPFSKICIFINTFLLHRLLKQWIKISKFNDPIVISFLPTPLIHTVTKKINPNLSIYYCANEMQGMRKKINSKLLKSEIKFAKYVNLIFVTSDNLLKKLKEINENIYKFPAGVELNKFNLSNKFIIPEDILNLKNKKIIGYVGALTRVIDQNLLVKCIQQYNDFNFIFIGREYADFSLLKKYKNCYFLGEKKHDLIPNYIYSFDICLIPYKINNFTDSVYSCKTNEYLALGKPVVATATNEIINIHSIDGNIIYPAKNYSEFINLIKTSINEDNNYINQRVNFANTNSWETRFKNITKIIDKNINQISLKNINWRENLLIKVKRFNKNLILSLSSITILLFLLFYSPLYSYSVNFFKIENNYDLSNNVVILLGHGSLNYINQNYQNRTLEFIDFYKKNKNINKIFITGRKQNINETDIVNAILITEEIPKNKIVLLTQTYKNTFDELININNNLKNLKIDNFVLITSYFHYLRASLILKKNFPNLKVNYYQQNYSESISLRKKLNDYLLIAYEFTSIMYNKILGKI